MKETVVFAEVSPRPYRGRLAPHEVITIVEERGKTYNHWYDCDVMKNGTLLYTMSGAGPGWPCPYTDGGPFWAAKGLEVKNSDAAPRRLRRLPLALAEWPPVNSREVGRIVWCDKCGALPEPECWDFSGDQDLPASNPCRHLIYSAEDDEWVMKPIA